MATTKGTCLCIVNKLEYKGFINGEEYSYEKNERGNYRIDNINDSYYLYNYEMKDYFIDYSKQQLDANQ